MTTHSASAAVAAEFAKRIRLNQQKLRADLKPRYDVIVCGSRSSGSVVARRLAENAHVSMLLLETGGDDQVPSVMEANQWPMNLGSERDWSFRGQPNPRVNGRSLPFSMGKVLGGGSSINVMVRARGHKSDWDFCEFQPRSDGYFSRPAILPSRAVRPVSTREDGDACMSPMPE